MPLSVKSLDEQIQKNSAKYSQVKEKMDNTTERQKYSKFIDSAKAIVKILSVRNRNNMSQLLDEPNLNIMNSAVKKIEDMFSAQTLDQDDLNEQIDKIGRAINSIGEARRGGKEDIDSLTILITKLKGFGGECGDLIRVILKSNTKEQGENTTKALDRLVKSSDSKSKLVIDMRGAFARYTGRR